jgi:hypothetical protein
VASPAATESSMSRVSRRRCEASPSTRPAYARPLRLIDGQITSTGAILATYALAADRRSPA